MEHWINYKWKEAIQKFNQDVLYLDENLNEQLSHNLPIVSDRLGSFSFTHNEMINIKFQGH